MTDVGSLRSAVRNVLTAQRFCVLATQKQGQPYGSLVAFAETDDLKQLVLATRRDTRKFANLMSEPRVALVIDSRSNSEADLRDAVAVTVLGQTHEAVGAERERLARLYLGKHPMLAGFIGSPGTALCAVAVEEYVIAGFSGATSLRP